MTIHEPPRCGATAHDQGGRSEPAEGATPRPAYRKAEIRTSETPAETGACLTVGAAVRCAV
jgi:hypothetical protein